MGNPLLSMREAMLPVEAIAWTLPITLQQISRCRAAGPALQAAEGPEQPG